MSARIIWSTSRSGSPRGVLLIASLSLAAIISWVAAALAQQAAQNLAPDPAVWSALASTVVIEKRHVETQEIRHVVVIDATDAEDGHGAERASRDIATGAIRLDAALRPDGYVGRIGAVYAPAGDLDTDGFRLRATALGAALDYGRSGGDVDLDIVAAELLVGYDFFLDDWRLGAFIGPEVVQHADDPDDAALNARGLDWGAKLAAQVEAILPDPLYFGINAEYGTAKGGYDLRARVGLPLDFVTIGPEAALFGDLDAVGMRAGLFIDHVAIGAGLGGVTLSGGFGVARVEERGGGDRADDAGVYATLGLTAPF